MGIVLPTIINPNVFVWIMYNNYTQVTGLQKICDFIYPVSKGLGVGMYQ